MAVAAEAVSERVEDVVFHALLALVVGAVQTMREQIAAGRAAVVVIGQVPRQTPCAGGGVAALSAVLLGLVALATGEVDCQVVAVCAGLAGEHCIEDGAGVAVVDGHGTLSAVLIDEVVAHCTLLADSTGVAREAAWDDLCAGDAGEAGAEVVVGLATGAAVAVGAGEAEGDGL